MPQSTKALKPKKPHKDFPLTPHPTGRWCKKILGKLVFFGKWDAPDAALANWLAQKDDLLAGRKPRPTDPGGSPLGDLINLFLNFKRHLVDAGELSHATWRDYKRVGERLVKELGRSRTVSDLRPDDFERLRVSIAKKTSGGAGFGPVATAKFITCTKVIFKYAFDNEIIERPVRFGQGFKRPAKALMRKVRNERGTKMFSAEELRKMLAAASDPLKTMILLGANCGFGNADCGTVPIVALDLQRGWIDFPRPKTHVKRRCPLWPETVQAITAWRQRRPHSDDVNTAGLLFITKYGQPWFKHESSDNPVSKEMRKLLDDVGIKRQGLSFYGLRHGFETIAGETLDQPAIDIIMGHAAAPNDMAAVYREAVDDSRLLKVVDHVRTWLWPETATPRAKTSAKTKPKAR